MSWLSQLTGVHISPKGASLSAPDPIGAIKSAASNPLFDAGLALAVPGVGSAIGGALSSIPGASAVGGALSKIPGVSSLGNVLGLGGGADAAAGGAIPDSAFGGDSGGGFLGTLEGLAGKAGSFLTGNNGLNALGLAQGVSSVLDQKKASDYANEALNTATSAYNAKAPLRAQGLQGLLSPQTSDLSGLKSIAGTLQQSQIPATPLSQFTAPQRQTTLAQPLSDPGNPYARRTA